MEDFVFVEGKPSFKPSALWECMEQGKSITLDEINLLPFDSLRFLQGILDGKKEFLYKGHTVTIADGFEIIGTMNLVVNGSVFNLPEPLVDRCAYIEKFELTAEDLYSAF
jgi:MoxR-like ATPase